MAFKKRCYHCSAVLPYQTLLRQTAVMKCPACGSELDASFLSKVIFSLIFMIPFVLILMGLLGSFSKIIAMIIWIIISFLVVQPSILRYK